MGVLEEALGNSAPPHTIEHGGRVYRARLIDYGVQAAFARALLARAKEAARELKELMSPEAFALHLARLNDDYLRGEYGLLSPRGQQLLTTTDGIMLLAGLIFDCPLADLVGLFIAHPTEVNGLIALVIEESFPGAAEAARRRADAGDGTPTGVGDSLPNGASPGPARAHPTPR